MLLGAMSYNLGDLKVGQQPGLNKYAMQGRQVCGQKA